MNETTPLLHNMSAPPKSVAKYSGLGNLLTQTGPGGSGATSLKLGAATKGPPALGQAVRFVLPAPLVSARPEAVLQHLRLPCPKCDEGDEGDEAAAHKQLQALINERAAALPLPEGCAVIKAQAAHAVLFSDALAALAAFTKSTDTVWLRAKTPSLSSLSKRTEISLLVPMAFVDQLPKEPT